MSLEAEIKRGGLDRGLHDAARHGISSAAGYVGAMLQWAFYVIFGGGIGFKTYWGAISWTATPILFGNEAATEFIDRVLLIGTLVTLTLVALRAWSTVHRLVLVGRRRSWATAIEIALADTPFNSYAFFNLIMIVLFIYTGGEIARQGRYWLPFLLPATLCAIAYAPRVLRRPGRPAPPDPKCRAPRRVGRSARTRRVREGSYGRSFPRP